MERRDFLTLWLQALLLSLFPWLRTEKGLEVAGRVAEAMVPQTVVTDRAIFRGGMLKISTILKGFEVGPDWHEKLHKIAVEQGLSA